MLKNTKQHWLGELPVVQSECNEGVYVVMIHWLILQSCSSHVTVVLDMIRFKSLMNRHRLNFSIIWVVTYFGIHSKICHDNRSVLMERDG